MISESISLAELGWRNHFMRQIRAEDADLLPVRVMAVHRDRLDVKGEVFAGSVVPIAGNETVATAGDWVLIEPATGRAKRILDRFSLFKRRAAGTGRAQQLIAANVDVLFIVSSCNQDFNVARLERYLALAAEAEVMPIVVLTKADLAADAEDYARTARALMPNLLVETVDARDPRSLRGLAAWCGKGQTVALAGSSGVDKSTLVNTLTGTTHIATQGIREDDAHGRHTTTGRALHRLPAGGWLLDTPGMRELQLLDVHDGLDRVFADIAGLEAACRFHDCRHETEPGCAVLAAIAAGELDPDRFRRLRKLQAEEARNSETVAERHARDKAFGKMVKTITGDKTRSKNMK